jgi:pimeloyl-ACP methyl ester carboxylesterase
MPAVEGYLTTPDGVRLFFRKIERGPGAVIVPNAAHMFDSFENLPGGQSLIFFDLRNRGASDPVAEPAKLERGIHHDVDDIEAVRQHFGAPNVDVIGHSYLGAVAVLYALMYPSRIRRIVQIGAVQADASTTYPPELTGADRTLAEFPAKAAAVSAGFAADPQRAAADFWGLIKTLMVADPSDAEKIQWAPFRYPNELAFMKQWAQYTLPSLQALRLDKAALASVGAKVLTVHGTRDRQSPYGAARDWVSLLPDARLLTVLNAAHVPWIEAPELVFGAIETFLAGAWPEDAAQIC